MITVIGLGFVGLTTALGFAEKGFTVYGIDIDEKKVNQLIEGELPFHEPHLAEKLKYHLNNNFFITDDLQHASSTSELIIYCVGTPNDKNGKVDLSYIFHSLEQTLSLQELKDKYRLLLIKSTVPPSTLETKIKPFVESFNVKIGKEIGIASNPEFLREGNAWDDFINPDRIVIGIDEEDKKGFTLINKYYKPFHSPIFSVTPNTAEFIKYLSNTLLSTLISFSNEQSMLAHTLGNIEIAKAFEVLQLDKRWFTTDKSKPVNMAKYVYPGCGFGGYCLPKDTQALLTLNKELQLTPSILEGVVLTNQKIKTFLLEKIKKEVDKEEVIGILGLAFKPNSDDVRESPSKEFIEKLYDEGYRNIIAYDPLAINNFKSNFNYNIKYAKSLHDTIEKSSTLIVLCQWEEFILQKDRLKEKKLFDFRYCLGY
ncbi:UDP-glucose 6-dehydrogenase [Sutcliffiella cohnii]|uniref:UDP-glucose 6-dehydrogenase n=1 Tax=Sutcliffiella cohnii TaxID=33932 RepID=A0A223KMB8_9BACI|nr:nucleotide sugar dehydrogenase [Sutcliffiella cohnii]AST90649.1 UDP-glucose 6-dehydrogenase [Sutcliffiella cohnii]